MLVSDFPAAYASGLRPQAFPVRPAGGLRLPPTGTAGISRFSGMERPRMLRVFDSAGPMSRLALSPRIVLPSLPDNEVGAPEWVITELNGWPACSPVNAYDVPLRPRRHDSGPWWVATAFHVRLFHPLLHAGLSRRFYLSPETSGPPRPLPGIARSPSWKPSEKTRAGRKRVRVATARRPGRRDKSRLRPPFGLE